MKKLLAGICALAIAGSSTIALRAQSAPQVPGRMDVSLVEAGTYRTDPAHTLVEWKVDHFGFNPYLGLFGDAEGTLEIDPANIAATRLDVTVPVTSVAVVSKGLRDHLLRPGKDGGKPDFFGPTPAAARFVANEVTRIGATRAVASGELTLNGVTRPLAMMVEFSGAGINPMSKVPTIGFIGEAELQRSEFGIDTAVPMVSDTVHLRISAAFERR